MSETEKETKEEPTVEETEEVSGEDMTKAETEKRWLGIKKESADIRGEILAKEIENAKLEKQLEEIATEDVEAMNKKISEEAEKTGKPAEEPAEASEPAASEE